MREGGINCAVTRRYKVVSAELTFFARQLSRVTKTWRPSLMRSQPSIADEESPARGTASCAPATLDQPSDRSEEREIEDVPRADGEEEEPPFTEDEVLQMHDEIRELAVGMYTDKTELDNFLGELDAELQENADLQERRDSGPPPPLCTHGPPSASHAPPPPPPSAGFLCL